jgi:hypothetical protein
VGLAYAHHYPPAQDSGYAAAEEQFEAELAHYRERLSKRSWEVGSAQWERKL